VPQERLQKIIARAGLASRRAAEAMIAERRVTVNGRVVDRLGAHADPDADHIKVDGKLLPRPSAEKHSYLAFKPPRMITSLEDPEGRPTVADLLRRARIRHRVFPVGRLDWDADGLLLLTDDGDLAHRVAHPSTHLPKTYRVKVRGHPDERTLERVRRGVLLAPRERTLPSEVTLQETREASAWLKVTLVEGRQNQIKRMFERIGHPVQKIRRTRIGPLTLGKLRAGEVRPLRDDELRRLVRVLDRPERPGTPRRAKRSGEGGGRSRRSAEAGRERARGGTRGRGPRRRRRS
jgi:pseudouridine synthase